MHREQTEEVFQLRPVKCHTAWQNDQWRFVVTVPSGELKATINLPMTEELYQRYHQLVVGHSHVIPYYNNISRLSQISGEIAQVCCHDVQVDRTLGLMTLYARLGDGPVPPARVLLDQSHYDQTELSAEIFLSTSHTRCILQAPVVHLELRTNKMASDQLRVMCSQLVVSHLNNLRRVPMNHIQCRILSVRGEGVTAHYLPTLDGWVACPADQLPSLEAFFHVDGPLPPMDVMPKYLITDSRDPPHRYVPAAPEAIIGTVIRRGDRKLCCYQRSVQKNAASGLVD